MKDFRRGHAVDGAFFFDGETKTSRSWVTLQPLGLVWHSEELAKGTNQEPGDLTNGAEGGCKGAESEKGQ